MQANEITLSVDVLNNGTTVDSVFRRHSEDANRSLYIVDGSHVPGMRDQLQFYRTAEKPAGESRGVTKSALKFTLDVAVPNASGSGNIVSALIGEASFRIPVGVTAAQSLELRQRMIAALDHSLAAALNDQLEI